MGDKLRELIENHAKGIEYLRKLKKGRTPQIERMEESIMAPEPPVPPPNVNPQDPLLKKSSGGSPAMTAEEFKKGYRKL